VEAGLKAGFLLTMSLAVRFRVNLENATKPLRWHGVYLAAPNNG
jgi:hypothetical protein